MSTLQIDRPKRGRPKLSDAMEAALFAAFCKAASAEDLAEQFGVCRATVYNIVNRMKKESRLALDSESGATNPETGDSNGVSRSHDTVSSHGEGPADKEGS